MKFDWYQSDSQVVVSFMTKNAKVEEVSVNIEAERLEVSRKVDEEVDTVSVLLLKNIDASKSSYKILSTKIEVKLIKTAAERWSLLERKEEPVKSNPTVKDWDRIVSTACEDDEKATEGDQAVNELFQQIYKNADENTRKAMNKSFTESGGTVLSTNWNEVGNKKIEVQPPDGMEYKSYEG